MSAADHVLDTPPSTRADHQPVAHLPPIHKHINRDPRFSFCNSGFDTKPAHPQIPRLRLLIIRLTPPWRRLRQPWPAQSQSPPQHASIMSRETSPARSIWNSRSARIPPPQAPPATHASPCAAQSASQDAPAHNASPAPPHDANSVGSRLQKLLAAPERIKKQILAPEIAVPTRHRRHILHLQSSFAMRSQCSVPTSHPPPHAYPTFNPRHRGDRRQRLTAKTLALQ